MAKKNYNKIYLDHFKLGDQDQKFCEYSFIKLGAWVYCSEVHHIVFKSRGGKNEINNLMALNRKYHDMAHNEQLSVEELQEIHQQFIDINPY